GPRSPRLNGRSVTSHASWLTDRMLRRSQLDERRRAMRTHTRTGMALTVLALALAISSAAAGPALAGQRHTMENGPRAAFSDPNWSPATSSPVTAGRGAFSDLNYDAAPAVGRGAFSDLNAFGPIPTVGSAQVAPVDG